MDERPRRSRTTARISPRELVGALVVFSVWWAATAGFSLASLLSGVGAVTVLGAAHWVSQRPRPSRSYLWLLLASSILFGLLVMAVSLWGGDILLSFITWAGITGIATF
jgi:hypothetical protein